MALFSRAAGAAAAARMAGEQVYVYETFFRPYISQHENDIDRNILEFRARASDMLIIYWQKSATLGQNTFFNILKYVAALQSPSQLSRPHPAQQRSQLQKQQKSQPPQQQQVPLKESTTLRRAASAAARQAEVHQSQETQTATTTSNSKFRRLTTAKSAPATSAKFIPVANTENLVAETKTSAVKVAAEEAAAAVSNANAQIHETNASPLPESETDDMVIDEDVVTTEETVELDATPETTPMEEAIPVTRARLRRRVATGTTIAAGPAVS